MAWFLVLSVYLDGNLRNEFSTQAPSLEVCQQRLAGVAFDLEEWVRVAKRGVEPSRRVSIRWHCRESPARWFACESARDQRCRNTDLRRGMRLEPAWLESLRP